MQFKIICVGKMKEKFMRQAIDYYMNKIKQKHKIEIIEIPCEKTPEDLNNSQMQLIKSKECEKILAKIDKQDYVILLDAEGKVITSKEIGNIIYMQNNKKIVFIIGGSLGVNSNVLNTADTTVSFSKMTFPHQLMRIFLLEQLSKY